MENIESEHPVDEVKTEGASTEIVIPENIQKGMEVIDRNLPYFAVTPSVENDEKRALLLLLVHDEFERVGALVRADIVAQQQHREGRPVDWDRYARSVEDEHHKIQKEGDLWAVARRTWVKSKHEKGNPIFEGKLDEDDLQMGSELLKRSGIEINPGDTEEKKVEDMRRLSDFATEQVIKQHEAYVQGKDGMDIKARWNLMGFNMERSLIYAQKMIAEGITPKVEKEN